MEQVWVWELALVRLWGPPWALDPERRRERKLALWSRAEPEWRWAMPHLSTQRPG